MLQRAHVIALRPIPTQETLFLKAAGCARLAYNWALAPWTSECQAGGKPNWMRLQKDFIARIDTEFPFLREVPTSAHSPAPHAIRASRPGMAINRPPRSATAQSQFDTEDFT